MAGLALCPSTDDDAARSRALLADGYVDRARRVVERAEAACPADGWRHVDVKRDIAEALTDRRSVTSLVEAAERLEAREPARARRLYDIVLRRLDAKGRVEAYVSDVAYNPNPTDDYSSEIALVWSPDGRQVLYYEHDDLVRIAVPEGRVTRTKVAHSDEGLSFSPNGAWLVAAVADDRAVVFDASGDALAGALVADHEESLRRGHRRRRHGVRAAKRHSELRLRSVVRRGEARQPRGRGYQCVRALHLPERRQALRVRRVRLPDVDHQPVEGGVVGGGERGRDECLRRLSTARPRGVPRLRHGARVDVARRARDRTRCRRTLRQPRERRRVPRRREDGRGAGRGPLRQGDDGRGTLAGAFLLAGAQAVLLSNADLELRASLKLGQVIHRNLAEGDTVAQALWRARRQLDPRGEVVQYYLMEVVGSGHEVVFDSPFQVPIVHPNSRIWAVLASFVSAGVATVLIRKRKSHSLRG